MGSIHSKGDRSMITSEQITRIYVEILQGTPQKESLVPITPESVRIWNQIAAEVAQMRQDGKGFDIPAEIPEVEPVPNGPARKLRDQQS